MNAGFRNLLVRRDASRFNAFLLAIAVQMLLLPILEAGGLIRLTVPAFHPVGAVAGGFLFGMAMNWSGGCPAGVWYKLGGGAGGPFVAIATMIIGYRAVETGLLSGIREAVQFPFATGVDPSPTLSSLTGLPFHLVAAPLSVVLALGLWRYGGTSAADGAWPWRRTGLWVGVVGVAAWVAASGADRAFGMAILPGSAGLPDLVNPAGSAIPYWDLFFVIGIAGGGWLAARRSGPVKWAFPSPMTGLKLGAGGFLLGATGSLAGGCTVGHGLAGIPLLSVGSLVFIGAAMLGSWSGVALEAALKRFGSNG